MTRLNHLLAASAAVFAIASIAGAAQAGDKEISRQVSFGGSCVKCELSGRNLSGARIIGANFSGATLVGAILRDAKFHASVFAGADLTKADLSDAAMTGANFSGANLTSARLRSTEANGVSFGNGSIRADRGPGGLKITNITLPSGYSTGLGGQPRRVAFKWGKGRVKYAGFLAADNVDVYLVQARQGDLLNAQLERVRVERASLRVVNSKDNRVLTPTAPGDPQRGWAGPVPESGEYRVEVVRRGAYCDPPATYQVTISLD